ncbi:MAG: hypothetical protein WD772_09880 [Pseudohongiellaceae bacterium]
MQDNDSALIRDFIHREALPQRYSETATQWLLPLARQLQLRMATSECPFIVGLGGAQGTGKSTAARFLCDVMAAKGFRAASVSIDDFYLSHARRRQLGKKIHPLLTSRGVPGTHDLPLLSGFLKSVQEGRSGRLCLPRFSKASDNPLPEDQWPAVALPLDLLVLDGWFLGARPQRVSTLEEPVNVLEQTEDPDGSWRRFVNEKLADYQRVFAVLDYLALLKAPSFDCVYRWRRLQEAKLIASDQSGKGIMNRQQLDRFIQHFERLTRHCLDTLPATTDALFELNESQTIVSAYYREVGTPTT